MIKALKEEKRAKAIRAEIRLSKELPNEFPTAKPPIEMTPFMSSGGTA